MQLFWFTVSILLSKCYFLCLTLHYGKPIINAYILDLSGWYSWKIACLMVWEWHRLVVTMSEKG